VGLKRSLVGIGAALARMDVVRGEESHVTRRDAPRLGPESDNSLRCASSSWLNNYLRSTADLRCCRMRVSCSKSRSRASSSFSPLEERLLMLTADHRAALEHTWLCRAFSREVKALLFG
jgi:hypothetical protein